MIVRRHRVRIEIEQQTLRVESIAAPKAGVSADEPPPPSDPPADSWPHAGVSTADQLEKKNDVENSDLLSGDTQ
jgi:hypothetical protein